MNWLQTSFKLSPRSRGFHLITADLLNHVPQVSRYQVGLMHVFIQHTSAALGINENADPTVRADLEAHFNVLAPESAPYFVHTYEGPDDMPAHIKAMLLGSSVSVPISDGCLALGTWQGIYLCEHRNHGGARRLVVTLQGELREAG